MTFCELERTLPNGFHHVRIVGVSVDYAASVVTLAMEIFVDTAGQENIYRPAVVVATGIRLFTMESPDLRYPFTRSGPLPATGDQPGTSVAPFADLADRLPPQSTWYRFFVERWNSFINIVAEDVSMSWSGEGQV